jgi:hypothetical protein
MIPTQLAAVPPKVGVTVEPASPEIHLRHRTVIVGQLELPLSVAVSSCVQPVAVAAQAVVLCAVMNINRMSSTLAVAGMVRVMLDEPVAEVPATCHETAPPPPPVVTEGVAMSTCAETTDGDTLALELPPVTVGVGMVVVAVTAEPPPPDAVYRVFCEPESESAV